MISSTNGRKKNAFSFAKDQNAEHRSILSKKKKQQRKN